MMAADTNLREALAALSHEQWSGWMQFLFQFVTYDAPRGAYILDKEKVTRWQRQMTTPYADLPEAEKESDRAEAGRVLALLLAHAALKE